MKQLSYIKNYFDEEVFDDLDFYCNWSDEKDYGDNIVRTYEVRDPLKFYMLIHTVGIYFIRVNQFDWKTFIKLIQLVEHNEFHGSFCFNIIVIISKKGGVTVQLDKIEIGPLLDQYYYLVNIFLDSFLVKPYSPGLHLIKNTTRQNKVTTKVVVNLRKIYYNPQAKDLY